MKTRNHFLAHMSARAAVIALLVSFVSSATAALLGINPGYPLFKYDNTGVTAYDAGTMAFSVNADPIGLTFNLGDAPAFVVAPRSMKLNIAVDGLCNVAGSNPGGGFDLEVIGDVFDQNFVLIKSGVLLTGDIVSMGQEAAGTPLAVYDFQFTNAGGQLVTDGDWPLGQDIGVVLNSENSTFTGDCTVNFTGGAKGDIGPVPPIPMGDVCDLTLVKTATPDVLGPFSSGYAHNSGDTDSDSGVDNDGSGDTDDSDSDSEADSADSDAGAPPCGCKGRVKQLTMRYNKPTANTLEVRRANGQVLFGPQLLQPGEEFTFAVKGKRIKFLINMEKVARLKTSCKDPVGSGQTIGDNADLIVVSGLSKFRNTIPLCPFPGSTCAAANQVTYTYDITNNGTDVTNAVLFDDQLGVIGDVIPTIPGFASAPNNVVSVQATTCIFKNTINKATVSGLQGVDVCESNEAQETVTVLQDCPSGDTDSDSGIDFNGNADTDDSDADSGEMDCDLDEPRSCFGDGTDTDSDSGIDRDGSGDSDDSDTDSGTLDCDLDGS